MRTPLLILDCETTGVEPDRHTIWEIAWCAAIHDSIAKTLRFTAARRFSVQLTPAEMMRADPAALEVGHYATRYPEGGGIDPVNVKAQLGASLYDLGHHGDFDDVETVPWPHLVGAVPSFDHAMLCMNWLGWPRFGEGLYHYHLVDVEALAAGNIGYAPPWDSDILSETLGITPPAECGRHTAIGDVIWAAELYAAVYGLEILDDCHLLATAKPAAEPEPT